MSYRIVASMWSPNRHPSVVLDARLATSRLSIIFYFDSSSIIAGYVGSSTHTLITVLGRRFTVYSLFRLRTKYQPHWWYNLLPSSELLEVQERSRCFGQTMLLVVVLCTGFNLSLIHVCQCEYKDVGQICLKVSFGCKFTWYC